MDSFTGEIRAFPYNFAPDQWAYCNGAQVAINQNPALYSILAGVYGSDYKTYFNLPNLNGLVTMSTGQGPGLSPRVIAQVKGQETVTLSESQMPVHTHDLYAGASSVAANRTPAPKTAAPLSYATFLNDGTSNKKTFDAAPTGANAILHLQALSTAPGNALPHENRQPYLPFSWCISLYGVYPIRP